MGKVDELIGQSSSRCLNVFRVRHSFILSCKDRGVTWYCFEISIIAALYYDLPF